MTEQALFILASLGSGELHGYAIAQDVEQMSEGRVRLAAGTLYGALKRLMADGLIAESRELVVDGRRRRYYELTSAGETALTAEASRLRSTAAAITARSGQMGIPRPRPV